MSILGTRVLRTEDPGFLSTGAVYTEDVQDERLAGACYVHFVRSIVAHAKIVSIDTSAAKDGEGVVAVYTAADLAADGVKPLKPMAPNMNQAMLQTLLASDTVRFVGEPVAAVVTEEMYQGEDAIELVDVDYDPLPAVVDMNDALSGAKGLLFPEAGTNVVCTFGDPSAADRDSIGAGATRRFWITSLATTSQPSKSVSSWPNWKVKQLFVPIPGYSSVVSRNASAGSTTTGSGS